MLNIFNQSRLKQLCLQYHLTPSKKYGQNFLINPEPIEKMILAAELTKKDIVVEIGPGFGALTFALAEKAKRVVAFEIEKKLKPYWEAEKEKRKLKNLEVVWGNVLKVKSPKVQRYKVVANLPYQIISQVIRHFLEAEYKPELMVLMVQKEVAERICARPTSPSDEVAGGRAKPGQMSLLAVAVQYYARPEIIAKVPRTYFWPEPEVDSAVIRLKVNKVYEVHRVYEAYKEEERCFFQIIKAGFANKRKLLIKNLEAAVGKKNRRELETIFMKLSLAPTVRAQELSMEQWNGLVDGCFSLVPFNGDWV